MSIYCILLFLFCNSQRNHTASSCVTFDSIKYTVAFDTIANNIEGFISYNHPNSIPFDSVIAYNSLQIIKTKIDHNNQFSLGLQNARDWTFQFQYKQRIYASHKPVLITVNGRGCELYFSSTCK